MFLSLFFFCCCAGSGSGISRRLLGVPLETVWFLRPWWERRIILSLLLPILHHWLVFCRWLNQLFFTGIFGNVYSADVVALSQVCISSLVFFLYAAFCCFPWPHRPIIALLLTYSLSSFQLTCLLLMSHHCSLLDTNPISDPAKDLETPCLVQRILSLDPLDVPTSLHFYHSLLWNHCLCHISTSFMCYILSLL